MGTIKDTIDSFRRSHKASLALEHLIKESSAKQTRLKVCETRRVEFAASVSLFCELYEFLITVLKNVDKKVLHLR